MQLKNVVKMKQEVDTRPHPLTDKERKTLRRRLRVLSHLVHLLIAVTRVTKPLAALASSAYRWVRSQLSFLRYLKPSVVLDKVRSYSGRLLERLIIRECGQVTGFAGRLPWTQHTGCTPVWDGHVDLDRRFDDNNPFGDGAVYKFPTPIKPEEKVAKDIKTVALGVDSLKDLMSAVQKELQIVLDAETGPTLPPMPGGRVATRLEIKKAPPRADGQVVGSETLPFPKKIPYKKIARTSTKVGATIALKDQVAAVQALAASDEKKLVIAPGLLRKKPAKTKAKPAPKKKAARKAKRK